MVSRSYIYFLDPGPTVGSEERSAAGRPRPYLVISSNRIARKFGIAIAIPGTTRASAANIDPGVVVKVSAQETGLREDSVFLCHQILRLDLSKFPITPAGRVSSDTLDKIQRAVEYCLGFDAPV
jgi:mRNA interferase MazF